MSRLNKDILFLLFEELQSDSKSLFSCLLVSRLWCETVIPILWRDPWCCCEKNIDYHQQRSLYRIMIFSLPDEVKEFLTNQGIQFFQTSHRPLLFDYLSFCRSISMKVIKSIISWSSSIYVSFLLQQEIYRLCLRK